MRCPVTCGMRSGRQAPSAPRRLQGVRRPHRQRPALRQCGLGKPTPLSALPERIEPGHPEQNGRLERFHRTLDEETATGQPEGDSLRPLRHSYNDERPHEALGQVCCTRPRSGPILHVSARRSMSRQSRCQCPQPIKWKPVIPSLKGEPVGPCNDEDLVHTVRTTPGVRRSTAP